MKEIKKRQKKNGKISYTACIRIKGYKTLTATFERKTDAQIWIAENESAMKTGKYIDKSDLIKHTLGDVIDRYIDEKLPYRTNNERYRKEFENRLLWWKDKLGKHLLKDITPKILAKYRDILLKEPNGNATKTKDRNKTKRSFATVNKDLGRLSTVLTTACNEWEWIKENPMFKVEKFKVDNERTRFLTKEEQAKLLNACKEHSTTPLLYMLVVLALSTGARRGELLNLKWNDVRFNDKEKNVTLYFMKTKNGTNRDVTIDKLGYELLKEHSKVRKINTKLIFAGMTGKNIYDLRKQWEKALRIADIEDFRFHDLRHTTASNLAMNGASLRDIAEILGHKTMQMTKRYSHLTKKYTTKVLQELNDKQFSSMT